MERLSGLKIHAYYTVEYWVTARITVACKMDFSTFPLDTQRCPFFVQSSNFNSDQMHFTSYFTHDPETNRLQVSAECIVGHGLVSGAVAMVLQVSNHHLFSKFVKGRQGFPEWLNRHKERRASSTGLQFGSMQHGRCKRWRKELVLGTKFEHLWKGLGQLLCARPWLLWPPESMLRLLGARSPISTKFSPFGEMLGKVMSQTLDIMKMIEDHLPFNFDLPHGDTEPQPVSSLCAPSANVKSGPRAVKTCQMLP